MINSCCLDIAFFLLYDYPVTENKCKMQLIDVNLCLYGDAINAKRASLNNLIALGNHIFSFFEIVARKYQC